MQQAAQAPGSLETYASSTRSSHYFKARSAGAQVALRQANIFVGCLGQHMLSNPADSLGIQDSGLKLRVNVQVDVSWPYQ